VATFPDNGTTVEALVDCADQSIARALEDGGDRVVTGALLRREEDEARDADEASDLVDEGLAHGHQPDQATPARPLDG
jgi:hypothetical protein